MLFVYSENEPETRASLKGRKHQVTPASCSLGHPVSGVLSSPIILLRQTSPKPAGVQGHTRGEGNRGGPSLREETWPKGPQ